MSNLIDAEAGTERFGGYEAELKLVQADLSQQIEQIKETTGEPRKAAISRAERALEEADELVRWRLLHTIHGGATPRSQIHAN
jgi:vesicle transport through interaction with t-SNAREs protein 1